jgi:predicted nucleic acid-binding protein
VSAAWVIDSSVGFAWVHPDQATSATDKLLEQVAAGAIVVVPALWFSEMANSLLILQRRKKITREERKIALETLSAMSLTLDEEATRAAFQNTSDLAEKHGLTVYDATYLELALRRDLPLASRDAALSMAAKRCGLKTL